MKAAIATCLLFLTALGATPARAQDGQTPAPGEYRIGPEDILQVLVWRNDAMSRTVPVRPDGMISLPLLNDVKAAGLTTSELRDVLMKKLVEFMPNPEVSVIVNEVRSYSVSVLGEVTKPGRFELKRWTTVLDMLALAGGFTQFAGRNKIQVLRQDGNTLKRIPFNYNKVASGSTEQDNFFVLPGDVVLVP
ncbi:MAG: polysaccharide biosynthesis/export family protein [Candidatus Rokubacteria bacterium]|nr:polysaccharide biosynthesis/export family protein [Candidatus Rokubacteria bacterium]